MIHYESFTLANGLKVLVHEDATTELAVINLMYNVGARDEDPGKTGFAHLFEHLMFGGSQHIPSYDEPLQKVGGENNAFTSNDITNYYLTLPAMNLETGFWLESDRMLSLSFDPQVLEVQRKVVIEEFKQRYLNQPYGDVWLKLRPEAYRVHPYRWPTIGQEIAHIEKATMQDVKDFFFRFYRPNNAVMAVAGKVKLDQVKHLAEKWFGPIPAGQPYRRQLPSEPAQKEHRQVECRAEVPLDALYQAYHIPGHTEVGFHAADLAGDALGRGHSSRLYQRLVKEQKRFNSIHAYITGSLEPGLLVVSGNLNAGVGMNEAEAAVNEVIDELVQEGLQEQELEKVKNQAESSFVFGEVELLNRAMNICYGEIMGQPDYINQELGRIKAVDQQELKTVVQKVLRRENCTSLYYYRN
ncbi:MAG: insulinase family protein [Cytophagales bacterium]|nr:insulinase family protein [Cytophagales bacterium]